MSTARLIIESGDIFTGKVFAHGKNCLGEIIFNTSMTGYEEVLTDPSYAGQLVMMTYPLIGNYGINEDDVQSKQPHLKALLVKEYTPFPSHWRSKKTLKEYLEQHNILGIEGLDTRYITRKLRHAGAMKALLTTSTEPDDVLLAQLQAYEGIDQTNLVSQVSTTEVYTWDAPEKQLFNVAVIDCGVKYGILNQLKHVGCQVTVFPYNTKAETILAGNFDGVMLSNGPGNPEVVTETLQLIKDLIGKIPLFGICLGHQMLSIAMGFSLEKLPFGHHGVNHPIKNHFTSCVEITSQNHIYCTTNKTIPADFAISHTNLNDHTVAGIRSEKLKAFSVQYHPEANPGPDDSHYLFKDFIYLMKHQRFEHTNSEDRQHAKTS